MGIQTSRLFFQPTNPPKNDFGLIVLELKTPSVQLPEQEIRGIVHLQMSRPMPGYQL